MCVCIFNFQPRIRNDPDFTFEPTRGFLTSDDPLAMSHVVDMPGASNLSHRRLGAVFRNPDNELRQSNWSFGVFL